MAVQKESGNSKLQVSMLDREACSCEPSDASSFEEKYEAWSEQQETHWTLASAIYQYERKYKKWPEKLDDLIRPYPDNILAGERGGMRSLFDKMLLKLKTAKETKYGISAVHVQEAGAHPASDKETGLKPDKNSIVGTNGMLDKQWSQPLERGAV